MSNMIIYTSNDGNIKVDVNFLDKSIWMNKETTASDGKKYNVIRYNLDAIIAVR